MELVINALKWAFSSPRLALEGVLVLGLVAGGWAYNINKAKLDQIYLEKEGLEADLSEKIRLKDNELTVIRREKGKVIVKRVYVPPEGSVVIKRKDKKALTDKYNGLLKRLIAMDGSNTAEKTKLQEEITKLLEQIDAPPIIDIKDKGFTLHPGFGFEVSPDGWSPRLDLKFIYFKRWSALLGGSGLGVGVGVSRHLDDILWFRPANVELFGQYNFLPLKDKSIGTVGLRANF